MDLTFRHGERQLRLHVRKREAGEYTVSVDDRERQVTAELGDESTLHLVIDGRARTARVAKVGDAVHVALDGQVYVLATDSGSDGDHHGGTLASPQIVAPMPGKVLQVLVTEGQEVAEGDGLLILEAMKMENRITAEAAAVVTAVHVSDGEMVDGGTVLIELEYRDSSS